MLYNYNADLFADILKIIEPYIVDIHRLYHALATFDSGYCILLGSVIAELVVKSFSSESKAIKELIESIRRGLLAMDARERPRRLLGRLKHDKKEYTATIEYIESVGSYGLLGY